VESARQCVQDNAIASSGRLRARSYRYGRRAIAAAYARRDCVARRQAATCDCGHDYATHEKCFAFAGAPWALFQRCRNAFPRNSRRTSIDSFHRGSGQPQYWRWRATRSLAVEEARQQLGHVAGGISANIRASSDISKTDTRLATHALSHP